MLGTGASQNATVNCKNALRPVINRAVTGTNGAVFLIKHWYKASMSVLVQILLVAQSCPNSCTAVGLIVGNISDALASTLGGLLVIV